MQRFGAALTFLQRYHDHGDEFLHRIVTGDKTWISHFNPETKQQSIHWRHSRSPVRMKFKQTLSVRKVMCTVFWDRKGILLNDFLPRGVVLLHDNARPHTARRTAAVLTEFGWELFDHPPYSPDLAPSDFHVFLHLKKFLSSEIFTVLSGNYTVIATDNLSYLILGACLESFEKQLPVLSSQFFYLSHSSSRYLEPQTFRDSSLYSNSGPSNCGPLHSNSGPSNCGPLHSNQAFGC
ncbi:hypothetical protein ANN_26758 [Periplaneta americana]|uniref:Histone-lysine N-methyltransferase SETMAR n=1 Tax=Periplaneta americana TaxID=6978 RepID=A0ABQ8RYY8_PERAM|nr:hypothetical protein ANN_26758 [Periplaneta americana]